MRKPHKTRRARAAARDAEKKFADKIRKYAVSHSAPESDIEIFKDALGYGRLCDSILASDILMRRRGCRFLGRALERLRSENTDLHFQFWTFTHDRGHTSDRHPIIDLRFLRGLVDRTLRKLKLNGVYVIEIQGLGNHPVKGAGRTLMTHAHAVTWALDPPDLSIMKKSLNADGDWSNEFGAAPVDVRPVKNASGELAYLAYYLFKPPYDAKMLEHRLRGDRLKSTENGYKPEFAARLLELLSQIDIRDLVRASGDGKHVRGEWHRRLINWHRSRERWSPGKLPEYHFDNFWDRYRVKKKRRLYEPFCIIR